MIDARTHTSFDACVGLKACRGIGLAPSRSLAKGQRGRLAHLRVGEETELILWLRRAERATAASRVSVLVVEDDPDVRLAIEAVLNGAFSVTVVARGGARRDAGGGDYRFVPKPFDAFGFRRAIASSLGRSAQIIGPGGCP